MKLLITIIFMLLWGYICYKMAGKRNRDEVLGFLLGVCFGLFAVIGYAIAGNKNEMA